MIAPCTPERGPIREPLCDICDVMLRYGRDAVLLQDAVAWSFTLFFQQKLPCF